MTPIEHAPLPVVAASSSQYFQRTFNRLVVAPPIFETPVVPVSHVVPQFLPVEPVTPRPVVNEIIPIDAATPDTNIAIAIATAHAAPVSTLLLPPLAVAPSTFPIFPVFTPANKDDTAEKATSKPIIKTPQKNPVKDTEPIEPASNNNDLSQLPLETNSNVFNPYGRKPEKLKTQVEIVPVPLAYIAPPPLKKYQAIKHVHSFVPTHSKIIIRPVKYVRVPIKIRTKPVYSKAPYRVVNNRGIPLRAGSPIISRDTEPTTFSPFIRPNTKPPRL